MSDNPRPPDLSNFPFVMGCFALLLAVLAYVFNAMLEDTENPNRTPSIEINEFGQQQVVLQRNKYGHYVANGLINQQPVQFFVDTGATMVAIPEHIADRIGLQKGQSYYSETANGRSKSYSTRLDSLTLGAITMHNVPASISTGMEFDEILLGMSFLKHVEMIQQGRTLTLRLPSQSKL